MTLVKLLLDLTQATQSGPSLGVRAVALVLFEERLISDSFEKCPSNFFRTVIFKILTTALHSIKTDNDVFIIMLNIQFNIEESNFSIVMNLVHTICKLDKENFQ